MAGTSAGALTVAAGARNGGGSGRLGREDTGRDGTWSGAGAMPGGGAGRRDEDGRGSVD